MSKKFLKLFLLSCLLILFNASLVEAASLSGRVLLQVESRGEAWYVNPLNLQPVYLGSPETAFAIWNRLALGVSNKTLETIRIDNSLADSVVKEAPNVSVSVPAGREIFKWSYRGRDYNLSLPLDQKTYESYAKSSKVYSYYGQLPANWHEEYYRMFLEAKSGDNTIKDIVGQLKFIASKEKMSDDEMVNLALAFVQSIPYDHDKDLQTGTPNYPYETLFRRLGVCSDKTFLAVMMLRELGYGAAVIDLPAVNHAAVGIQCPARFAVFGSGYCYAETTNYLPIGVIPQNFGANGVVVRNNSFDGQFANVFRTSHLGQPELAQRTKGKEYTGVQVVYDLVARLRQLEIDLANGKSKLNNLKNDLDRRVEELNNLQIKMQAAKGSASQYNSLVASYNTGVNQYQLAYEEYKLVLNDYNQKVADYNQAIENFYPAK